ncbi:MAG: hypothetical protein ACRBBK_02550 [Paracoccaceae bacterium]
MKIFFEEFGEEKRLTLKFGSRVWSKKSLPTIGAVWSYLQRSKCASSVVEIRFDFTDTIWAEVPTILAVATLASQASSKRIIDFRFDSKGIVSTHQPQSDVQTYEGKLKFLSFLRSMSFFATLPKDTRISLVDFGEDGGVGHQTYDSEQFERLVNGISFQPFIQAITLIPLKVMKAADFHQAQPDDINGAGRLKSEIKKVNENAALNIASAGFHRGTMQRQRILLSVDKILQESLSNIIEHAYSKDEEASYFAFYARIRNPNSTFEDEFKHGLYSSGDEFDHSKDVNWTELYICDLGNGIESQIPHWLQAEEGKEEPNEKLVQELTEALGSKNRFLRASRLLFDHSLSRHLERSTFRSPQTGLQDVKRVLMDAGYVDITNCSSVSRRRFLANRGSQSNRSNYQESRTPLLATEQERQEILAQFPERGASVHCEAGTHLVYRSQLSSEIPPFKQPGYRSIGRKQAARILDVYRGEHAVSKYHLLFDKRFAETSQPSDDEVRRIIDAVRTQPRNQKITLFVRLSRNPYKNDVNEWLRLDNKKHGTELHTLLKKREVSLSLQIVDVLPVYAGWLRERIRSYASSRWLSESSLVEVGVFTNLFHFILFEKFSGGYRASRKTAAGAMSLVHSAATALRQMDSDAFWRSYPGNAISDVYINQDIDWIATRRKLGEVFSNDFPKIWGYLDFATSLQCLERYRVCERALLRFIAIIYGLNSDENSSNTQEDIMFLPTLVSSDNMTQRLAKSVQALFSEVASFDDAAVLVLSSVVVTGQTKDRAALGIPNDHDALSNMKVCFFDRDQITSTARRNDFSLMQWSPPAKERSSKRGNQKRIFRTAEVSPLGSLDIRIPHILERDGKRLENYQRDRAETYADFELLGALQFGHTQKSNRHELINLNFNALVPLAISTSHTSWVWLIDQFYDRERDAESKVIVVYPNQPHAEQIVQELKHREPKRVPSDAISFISAPFLKSRKTEPIIVSPRLAQRLSEHLSQLSAGENKPGGKKPLRKLKIKIFDAGVVTGRTIRAMQQQIENVFEASIENAKLERLEISFETISLVDRSGQPIYGSLLEKFSQNNKRYWRWDVPSLTENGTCRACLANRRIEEHSAQAVRSGRARRRFALAPAARTSDLFDDKIGNGDRLHWLDNLADIQVNRLPRNLQKVTFGYYGDEPNIVHLASALQYVSTFTELTRLLHRSDIALNRAMEIKNSGAARDGNADCLSILILASHLLLFYETFDKFERVNYAVEVFGMLVDFDANWNERNVRSLANYYGLLALYSLEADDIIVLKGSAFFCEWLRRRPLTNPHLINFIKDISDGGLPFPIELDEDDPHSDLWSENIQRLRSDSSLVVERLLNLLGNERVWHSGELYNGLAPSGITHRALQGDFRNLKDLISEAQGLGVFHCPSSVVDVILEQSERSDDVPINRHEKDVLRRALEGSTESLRTILFNSLISFSEPSTNEGAWSNRNATKKILKMMLSSDGDGIGPALQRLNSAYKNGANRDEIADLFDYVGIADSLAELPFSESVYLVPSLDCRRVVESVVQNSRHATYKISNPFSDLATGMDDRFAWARILREDDSVVLSIVNACEQDPECGSVYASRFPGFISEGNVVEVSHDAGRKLLTTNVKFNTLVRR